MSEYVKFYKNNLCHRVLMTFTYSHRHTGKCMCDLELMGAWQDAL